MGIPYHPEISGMLETEKTSLRRDIGEVAPSRQNPVSAKVGGGGRVPGGR